MSKTQDKVVKEDIKRITTQLKDLIPLLEDQTVLITGGSGFLGKYIVSTLLSLNNKGLKKPCKIISVDNHITSEKESSTEKTPHLTLIAQNIKRKLNHPGKVDYIIHAAGIASPIYYQKFPLETIDAAVTGTRNMLELAKKKKVKGFLFFSSSEIYGDPTPNAIPTKENYKGNVSCFGPRSCYDESKRLGETLCYIYHNLYNLPIKIVRPFNIYGPGMGPFDHRVIPTFILKALTGGPIPVHSSGKQTRTFCYISDAVTGFFQVLLSGQSGQAYNVGSSDNEINMNRLANILKKVFKGSIEIENIDYPKDYPQDEPQRRCPDLKKIKKDVKYRPQVSLQEGLSKTVLWCRKNWL